MRTQVLALLGALLMLPTASHAEPAVSFDQQSGRIQIQIDGRPFATYVWDDPAIRRPYVCDLHTPDGVPVTRHHPPREGQDPTDHATMHPGLWLAFGDLGAVDFWRNGGTVRHVEFVEPPRSSPPGGSFTVRNQYVAGTRLICEELCQIGIRIRKDGYLINWSSEFSGPETFSFGDQEEMGLGVRVATPIAANNGGQIRNSHGATGEAEVWGRSAAWCDNSGIVQGRPVGIMLMPDPGNFRPCWWHARDYGLLVANPFGRHALTRRERSEVTVHPGDRLKLQFGVLVHTGAVDLAAAYREWLADRPGTAD